MRSMGCVLLRLSFMRGLLVVEVAPPVTYVDLLSCAGFRHRDIHFTKAL